MQERGPGPGHPLEDEPLAPKEAGPEFLRERDIKVDGLLTAEKRALLGNKIISGRDD